MDECAHLLSIDLTSTCLSAYSPQIICTPDIYDSWRYDWINKFQLNTSLITDIIAR